MIHISSDTRACMVDRRVYPKIIYTITYNTYITYKYVFRVFRSFARVSSRRYYPRTAGSFCIQGGSMGAWIDPPKRIIISRPYRPSLDNNTDVNAFRVRPVASLLFVFRFQLFVKATSLRTVHAYNRSARNRTAR